jgi:hypothetical protein
MQTNSDFLPADYEAPKGESSYMKLRNGENKFRILSKPIIGWLDWKDNKPLRFQMKNKPAKPIDPAKSIKHFWAFVVWDYADGKIKILEITQATIQSSIQSLNRDEDWGSPFDYDIKVIRKGEKLDTEYSVQPSPKKPLTDEVKQALLNATIDMDQLFSGGDPFASGGNSHATPTKAVMRKGTPEWQNVVNKLSAETITLAQVKDYYEVSPELIEELSRLTLPF